MNKKEVIFQMALHFGYNQYSTIDDIDGSLWEEISVEDIADYLASIIEKNSQENITHDNHKVKTGDVVYVIGSNGVTKTKVGSLSTTYMYFNSLIKVENSFVSKEAAEQYNKNYN